MLTNIEKRYIIVQRYIVTILGDIMANKVFRKSRTAISTISNTGLLASHICDLGISYSELLENGLYKSSITKEDVIFMAGGEMSNYNRDLAKVTKELMNLKYYIKDESKDNIEEGYEYFKVINIVKEIERNTENGGIDITYNPEVSYFRMNNGGVVTLLKSIERDFSHISSKKLYEMIYSEIMLRTLPKGAEIEITYSLAELKLKLSVLDVSEFSSSIIDRIGNARTGDDATWESIYTDMGDKAPYQRWKNFETRVLAVAVEEINSCSDIRIRYENLAYGKGKAITKIRFNISYLSEVRPRPLSVEGQAEKIEAKIKSIKQKNIRMEQVLSVRKEFSDIYAYVAEKGYDAFRTELIDDLLITYRDEPDRVLRNIIYCAEIDTPIANIDSYLKKCVKEDYGNKIEKGSINGSTAKYLDYQQARKEWIEEEVRRNNGDFSEKDMDMLTRAWRKMADNDTYVPAFFEYIRNHYGMSREELEKNYRPYELAHLCISYQFRGVRNFAGVKFFRPTDVFDN